MSDAPQQPPPVLPPEPAPHINAATEAQRAARMAILVRIWIISALLVLALIGMAVTQGSKQNASVIWLVIVTVFGVVCIWHSYSAARRRGHSISSILWRQVFHWLVVLFFVKFIILMEGIGYVPKETGGPISLVILALGSTLAGVHFDWLFLVVGSLLIVTTFAQEKIEIMLPYLLPPLVIIGVVSIVLFYRRSRKK